MRGPAKASGRGQRWHWRGVKKATPAYKAGPAGGRTNGRAGANSVRVSWVGQHLPDSGISARASLGLHRHRSPRPGLALSRSPWLSWVPPADGRPRTSWPPQPARMSLRNLLLYVCLSPWLCFPGGPSLSAHRKRAPRRETKSALRGTWRPDPISFVQSLRSLNRLSPPSAPPIHESGEQNPS